MSRIHWVARYFLVVYYFNKIENRIFRHLVIVVYYKSRKRELKAKLMNESVR